MKCPKCNSEMTHIEHEPEVGILGGYNCDDENCDYFIPEWDIGYDNSL